MDLKVKFFNLGLTGRAWVCEMTACFKKAGNDSIGYTAWPWHFTKPWHNIFEHATPNQLNCFGVPLPGDHFWTEETLSLAQLRYPKWNMSEYLNKIVL